MGGLPMDSHHTAHIWVHSAAEQGASRERLLLIFNPQWQSDGQIISDFG